jgi:hypothetical protein
VEGLYDMPDSDEMDEESVILGGMIYRPAEDWMVGLYGGMASGDIDDNVIAAVKLAYVWD